MPALTGVQVRHAAALRTARKAASQGEALKLKEARREAYEERAAIIEYDGNQPRAAAERWARKCIETVRGNP